VGESGEGGMSPDDCSDSDNADGVCGEAAMKEDNVEPSMVSLEWPAIALKVVVGSLLPTPDGYRKVRINNSGWPDNSGNSGLFQ